MPSSAHSLWTCCRANRGRPMPSLRGGRLGSWLVAASLTAAGVFAAHAAHGVAAAHLSVVQVDADNTTNSVRVTATLAINEFRVREGSNRGDYHVQIGESAADDVAGGVLISSVAENGRNNFGTNNYPISAVHVGDNYRICTFVPTAPTAGSAVEYNVNVAAAWFPYDRFLGGTARNAAGTNGGTNDLFIGSPGLVLGSHFKGVADGKFIVDLRDFGIDARTDGVLLVNGARDENNFALAQVNPADGTWNVFVRDNAQPTYSTYEQDPVAFVFVPRTNTALISGRFMGNGAIDQFSGDAPAFTVTNLGTGRWELKIPGHSPTAGVLILSAEGGGYYNGDNIVSYQVNAAGDGWEIQSRDTPNNGLQTPRGANGEPEPVASFVFIPAATATLLAPAYNALNQALPTLTVAVSNPAPGPLTVTFYGREAPTPLPGPDFTVVVLPDSQNYAAEINGGRKEMWIAQCEWIITNRTTRNIAYVAHLGDIVQNGDLKGESPNLTEWRNVTNAMYRLENPTRTQLPHGIPYGLAVGNHDQEPNGDPTGTTSFYNLYFGVSRFLGRDYFGGHYGTNNNNHFDLFSASGLDFIVLYFEYDPGTNPAVLAWANTVLRTNAHRHAIAVTHYMGSASTPSTFSAQGGAIYHALKTNANLFLLLGGHVCGADGQGEGSRADTYNGRVVRTLISDYQCRTNGGNGMLRLMEFSPSNNLVVVQTFSPWTGEYETDENSAFAFAYNLEPPGGSGSPGTPFTALATRIGLAAGELARFEWAGLKPNKTYHWYVVVTDAAGNTAAGPVWQFMTAPNYPPVVSNRAVTVTGDAPAPLTLAGFDPNGDALSFRLLSQPARGLVTDFNPNAGTLTYVPARGYRGADRFTYQAHDGQTSSSVATMNLTVVAPPDTNANGLPDAWETAYAVTDPEADEDDDGMSNRAEYWAGTDPRDAGSGLRFLAAERLGNGAMRLSWSAVGGVRYRVQYREGELTGGSFTDIVRPLSEEMDTNPWGQASTQVFVDDFTRTGSAPTNPARHYRIRLAP